MRHPASCTLSGQMRGSSGNGPARLSPHSPIASAPGSPRAVGASGTSFRLKEELSVSRFTIRAALDALVADGLIERYRRRGTFIAARPEGAATWMVASLGDLVLSGFSTPPILLQAVIATYDSDVAERSAWMMVSRRSA